MIQFPIISAGSPLKLKFLRHIPHSRFSPASAIEPPISSSPTISKCISPTFPPDEEFFTEGVRSAVQLALPSLIQRGLEPIYMHIGAPIELPPSGILEKLRETISANGAHIYSLPRGEEQLLNAVAHHMKNRYGVEVNPKEEICIVPGSCPAIFFVLRDLVKQGITLIPTPGYPPYATASEKGGHTILGMPLSPANNFMPDVDSSIKELDQCGLIDDVHSLLVNYPHNPTGAVADLNYYRNLIKLAKQYNLLIVSDMAYGEIYNPTGEKPHSIFEIPGAKDVCIEIHTFGKTFSMTGDRAGFVIANRDIINLFETYLKHVHIGNVPKPIQLAVAHGLTSRECMQVVAERNIEYKSRFDLMTNGLRDLDWQIDNFNRAGFFLWVKVPEAGKTSREFFNDLLCKAGIVVVPGSDFGSEGEGYIRISLTQSREKLAEVLERLRTNGFKYDK